MNRGVNSFLGGWLLQQETGQGHSALQPDVLDLDIFHRFLALQSSRA